MRRGERMARWMLERLAVGGVVFELTLDDEGQRAIAFPNAKSHTAEQKELATDLVLFAIAFPRNFGTLCRLKGGAA